ncbi:UDP-N-acetylmuramoyl-L-alanine--D-glutamate ligase [Paraglaciecola sp.]|uniref:UDP-N-acetylmuramoyl-L-alanine--D-glutamate ligase n=1 Tax=Paraglaciecola sp. TaxID=1920173 RepID=UPI003EF4BB1A
MPKLVLENKNIVVVGLGLTGQSCVQFLLAKGANVVAMDTRECLTLSLDIPVFLGVLQKDKLSKADLIVVSPGVDLNIPALKHAASLGIHIIGDIELFAQYNTTPVIAITGSNGKTTVTHLVVEMCKAAGKKVLMGGNVGVPVLELLELEADVIVLELSSFQLDTTYSLVPLVATVLNISEDHLDRHGDLASYQQAKLNIFENAQHIVTNRDDSFAQPSGSVLQGVQSNKPMSFGLSASSSGFSWDTQNQNILFDGQPFLNSQTCMLVGQHNMLNIQAAAALAMVAGVDHSSIKQAAIKFDGLPHRCQTVSLFNKVRWINDSKATNVGATLAAIDGLRASTKGKLVLIAGGDGKGADFSPLSDSLQNSVQVLITFGRDGHKIAQLKAGTLEVKNLLEAVQTAAKYVKGDDVVLLSPACASLDMFANYQERGDCFTQAVKELAA